MGKALQRGFLRLFQMNKSNIIVHKNYGSENATAFEVVGMKNNEKNRPNNVMFQFSEYVDIVVGDVLQQKDGRILWKVYELDENIIDGTLLYFEAKVRKLESLAPMPSGITISNVSGNIQLVVIIPNKILLLLIQ
jgi:hypothetical protein